MAKKTKGNFDTKVTAYVDSGAFIAFCDKSDTWHSLFAGRFAAATALITTSLVIAETHGWFLRRFDSYRALQFMGFIESLNILEIREVGADDLHHGTLLLRKFSDQKLTLTDAVGLYLLKENKSFANWSTDRHMSLTGRRLEIDK